MTTLNTNISAIAAQNSLRTTSLNQTSAMERLSSGIRINSAKDDAAGLAISTRMTANIRGLAAAIRNANDGISLTQTAEGSLSAIGDNLQRIRELAVQSANTTNSASDRGALNAEASQLISEIDRVANNSTFNGIKLLDGSFQNQFLQVGAGNEVNDRISISIGNAKASALGVGGGSSWGVTLTPGANVPSTALAAGSLSINGFQVGATVADGISFSNTTGSGIAKAAAINAIAGQTGVTAAVSETKKVGVAATSNLALNAGDLVINGVDMGQLEAATSAVDRGTQTTAAINSKTAQTGVVATASSTGVVTLTAVDGRNITIQSTLNGAAATGLGDVASVVSSTTESATVTFGNLASGETAIMAGLTFTAGSGGATAAQVATAFSNLKVGATNTATNTALAAAGFATTTGTFTAGTLAGYNTFAGASGEAIFTSTTPTTNIATDLAVTGTGTAATGGTPAVPVITNTTESAAVTFGSDLAAGESVTFGGLTYTSTAATTKNELAARFANLATGATTGSATTLGTYSGTFTGWTTGAASGATVTAISATSVTNVPDLQVSATRISTSKLTLNTTRPEGITLGGAAGATSTGQAIGYIASQATPGAGVSTIDLSTTAGSQAALNTLDKAINTITDSRASMGAYQNRLTASIANLETSSMNLQASRSRILDTDYAKETTNLARSQIIQQAATAMLAQANQSAQSVLSLLK
jgi:flagellin